MSILATMRRSLIAATCCLALTTGAAVAQTPAPALTPEQRQAIEALVRETILKNPEILQEAFAELEKRNQVAQAEAQSRAVVTEMPGIVDPAKSGIIGNPQGDVTLVEFYDYNCGFCKRSLEDLRVMMKDDPKLKVVLKEFPVLGPESLEASRVAVAVKAQISGQKYWEFHAKLMATRGRINGDKALEVAKEFGVDIARAKKEANEAPVKAIIDETVALGDRLGLTGTPAFIVGNEVVFGAVGVEALKGKIAAVRQCGKATC
jgi:protein-disulfide isomerase